MYQVNNRITLRSEEQLDHLRKMFDGAAGRMETVPGFVSFRLLKKEDGSQLVVETVFESKEAYINWTESEHFARAHGGKSGSQGERQADLERFEVLIGSH
ncbi:antibiotic biosynthesis monooxygenase family protein [Salinithrix halophila]